MKHTRKTTERNAIEKLFGKRKLPDTTELFYKVTGNGFAVQGQALIYKIDSILKVNIHNIFTGEKSYLINIHKSGFPILDIAVSYIYGCKPIQRFKTIISDKSNRIIFIRNIDTVKAYIKGNVINTLQGKSNYIYLFYNTSYNIYYAKGKIEGFTFEVKVIK